MSDYSEDPLELPEVTYGMSFYTFALYQGLKRVFMADYLLKLICIGESGTGKTCLLHHYLNQDFRANAPHTIGVSFASTVLKLPSTLSPASSSALVGRGRKGSLVQPPIRSLKLQVRPSTIYLPKETAGFNHDGDQDMGHCWSVRIHTAGNDDG